MSSNSNSSAPQVPSDLVAEKRAGWHAFTQFTFVNCVALAALLLLMLVLFKVIL